MVAKAPRSASHWISEEWTLITIVEVPSVQEAWSTPEVSKADPESKTAQVASPEVSV